jgi:putative nucleotidyltransferase with HDIG domain
VGFIKRLGSWNAKLTPQDIQIVDTYLDDSGKFLFYQMSRFDQHHALAVTREIISQLRDAPGSKNYDTLIKAALLHDIGKVQGDFSFFSRILVGVVKRISPALRGKWAFTNPNTGWQKVRYGFYVDLIHPLRGAHMAKIFGIEPEIVEMIRHHHDPLLKEDTSDLALLQKADGKN